MWTAQWTGSISTAATTSDPACSKPRTLCLRHPQTSPTPIGLYPLLDSTHPTESCRSPFPCVPRKKRSGYLPGLPDDDYSHCHTTSVCQPNCRRSARFRASRARFFAILSAQKPTFDFGRRPILQAMSVPVASVHQDDLAKARKRRSGEPGRSLPMQPELYPEPLGNRRTSISRGSTAADPRHRADLACRVKVSTIPSS